jgi:hypothetical protein
MERNGKPAPVKEELRGHAAGNRLPMGPARPACSARQAGFSGTRLQNLQLTPSMLTLCEGDTIQAGRGRRGSRLWREPDC